MILIQASAQPIHKRKGAPYPVGPVSLRGTYSELADALCGIPHLRKARTSRTWDKVTCKRCLRGRLIGLERSKRWDWQL